MTVGARATVFRLGYSASGSAAPARAPASTRHLPHGVGDGMNRFYEDLIRQMEQEFERSDEVFRRFLHAFSSPERFWEPQADVYETREAVKVKVELAGVRPDS